MNKYKKEKYIIQRQLKTGWSFQVNFKTDGVTITKSFFEGDYGSARKAYDYAVMYRNSLLNKKVEDLIDPYADLTLKDVFEEMQDKSVFSNETKRKDLINFNKRIPCHDLPIGKITPLIIQDSLNKCVYDSNDVIQRVHALWHKIFDFAMLNDYVNIDCSRKVKIPKSKKIEIKRNVVFEGDIDFEKLNKIKDDRERFLLTSAILICLYTGARPGEVFALSKSDIIEDKISINKELGDNRNTPILRPCKTPESVRVIPVSSKLKKPLQALLNATDGDYLFTLNDGTFMSSKWAGDKLNRYYKGFNMYMLRHRASSIWDKNNVSLRTIDELMGHKSSTMSTSYARSDWNSKVSAVELL